MAQGDLLPALYTPSYSTQLYVDTVAGNDTTGTGAIGAPWKTVQKAQDYIKATLTWPGSGDIAVYCKQGTYQAASGQETLLVNYPTVGKRPSTNQRVIWQPWPGSEGLVKFENPAGTDQSKYCVRFNGAAANPAGFTSFLGIEFYGGDVVRGVNTSGTSLAVYVNDTTGNSTDITFDGCWFHGFKASGAAASAQAFQVESGGDNFRLLNFRVYDIGTDTGTIDNQEHGFYCQASTPWLHNGLIYNIPNGYAMQFFNGDAGQGAKITHVTADGAYASAVIIDDSLNNVVIANCIFTNSVGRGGSSYAIEFYPAGTPGTNNQVINLVHYGNQGGLRSSTPASGWTWHERNEDPGFKSTTDRTLKPSSRSISFAASSYSSFTDLNGVARPAGHEDAGAFEYPTSVDNDIVLRNPGAAFNINFGSGGGISLTPTAIAPGEAFDSPAVRIQVAPTAIASSEAVGTPAAAIRVAPTAIASAETFDSPAVRIQVAPTAIASAEAFDPVTIGGSITITPLSIPSAEGLGSPAVRIQVAPPAIASSESFGTPAASMRGAAISIDSSESVGTAAVALRVVSTSIATAESVGTPTIAAGINASGGVSGEAFDVPLVELAAYIDAIATAETFGLPTIGAIVTHITTGRSSGRTRYHTHPAGSHGGGRSGGTTSPRAKVTT